MRTKQLKKQMLSMLVLFCMIGILLCTGRTHASTISIGKNVTASWDSSTGVMTIYSKDGTLDRILFEKAKKTFFGDDYAGVSKLTSIYMSNDSTTLTLPKDSSGLFDFNNSNVEASALVEIGTQGWDTSNVEDASDMFGGNTKLGFLDVSNFDTSHMEDMSRMFQYCDNLSHLDLTNWDTSSCEDMSSMFEGYKRANRKNLSLKTWSRNEADTSTAHHFGMNVENMSNMFKNCDVNGNVRFISTVSCLRMHGMFENTTLDSDICGYETNENDTYKTQLEEYFNEVGHTCSDYAGVKGGFWDTKECIDMSDMFKGANFNGNDCTIFMNNVENASGMFEDANVCALSLVYCSNLENADAMLKNTTIKYINMFDFDGSKIVSASHFGDGTDIDHFLYDAGGYTLRALENADYMFANETHNCLALLMQGTENLKSMEGTFENSDLRMFEITGEDSEDENDNVYPADDILPKLKVDNVKNFNYCFRNTTLRSTIGKIHLTDWNASPTQMKEMFKGCKANASLILNDWDTSNVTDFSHLFEDMHITNGSLHMENWDTHNVTNMSFMFHNAVFIDANDEYQNTLVDLHMVACQNAESMFDSSDLTDTVLKNASLDGRECKNYKAFLQNCDELINADFTNKISLSKATDLSYFANDCTKLEHLTFGDGVQGSNITTIAYAFASCPVLQNMDMHYVVTNSVKNMEYLFDGDVSLASVINFNGTIDGLEGLKYAFNNCKVLSSNLDFTKWNVTAVTDADNVFNNCGELVSLKLTGWTLSNVTTMSHFMNKCAKLNDFGTTMALSGDKLKLCDYAFYDCEAFTTDFANTVSNIVMTNVQNARYMLAKMNGLTDVNWSGQNIKYGNGVVLDGLVSECKNLASYKQSTDSGKVTYVKSAIDMFYKCAKLKEIDLGHFDLHCMNVDKDSIDGIITGCDGLYKVVMPTKMSDTDLQEVEMPAVKDNMIWYDSNTEEKFIVDSIPWNYKQQDHTMKLGFLLKVDKNGASANIIDSNIEPVIYYYDADTVNNLKAPSINYKRVGYKTTGYSLNKNAETPDIMPNDTLHVNDLTIIDGEAALYQIWSPISYTVRYDANGGTGTMADQPVVYGTHTVLRSNAFTKEGSHFRGWAFAPGGYVQIINGGTAYNLKNKEGAVITLYAVWGNEPCVLRFYDRNKQLVAKGLIDKGASINDYKYISIDDDQFSISSFAICEENTPDLIDLGDERYTFDSWHYLDNDETVDFDAAVNKDTSIYIKQIPNTYKVYLHYNDTKDPVVQTYTFGTEKSLPTVEKNGYSFDGWYEDLTDEATKMTNISSDKYGTLNLYAGFTPAEYNITYDYSGGYLPTGMTNPDTYTVEDTFILNNPVAKGYSFNGWSGNILAAVTKNVIVPVGTNGDLEFKANFSLISYKIKYNLDGGKLATGKSNPSTYNIHSSFTLNNPSKDGYDFIGWRAQETDTPVLTKKIRSGTMGDLTFTAVYKSKSDPNPSSGPAPTSGPNTSTKPSDPTVSNKPNTTENPSDPMISGKPNTSANPSDPTISNKPNVSAKPNNPTVSGQPSTSSSPNKPIVSNVPGTSEKPNDPTVSGKPNTSARPNDPTISGQPNISASPNTSMNPSDPMASNKPNTSAGPNDPTVSGKPYPSTSEDPSDPTVSNRPTSTETSRPIPSGAYRITVDLNGGSTNEEIPYYYTVNDEVSLPDPVKKGAVFKGYVEEGSDITKRGVVIPKGSTGDKKFKAVYVNDIYDITYDLADGVMNEGDTNPVHYTVDDEFTLKNPVKTGYVFIGWSTYYMVNSSSGWSIKETEPMNPTIVTKGTTGKLFFIAKWKKLDDEFKISYDYGIGHLHDGDINPSKYTINDEFTLKNPECKGYDFVGWTVNESNDPIKNYTVKKGTVGDLKFTAVWVVKYYDIDYDLGGGILCYKVNPTQYTINDEFTLYDPTCSGREFVGWSLDGNAPSKQFTVKKGTTGHLSFTAVWKNKKYTINYDLGGGSLADGLSNPTTYYEGDTYLLNNPSRKGYEFIGWSLNNGEPNKSFWITKNTKGDLSLKAKWSAISYNINYELNGGTVADGSLPDHYTIEDDVKLPNPTKNGYVFVGWTCGNDKTKIIDAKISKGTIGNKTYTAWFDVSPYTITYDLNGGTMGNKQNPTKYTIDDEFTIHNPTRNGYTFLGWSVNGTKAKTTVSIKKGTQGDMSLKAKWSVNTYKIKYKLKGGTLGKKKNPKTYTIEKSFTLKNPKKKGYTFRGWKNSNTGDIEKKIKVSKGTTGDIVFTALWEKIKVPDTYVHISKVINKGSVFKIKLLNTKGCKIHWDISKKGIVSIKGTKIKARKKGNTNLICTVKKKGFVVYRFGINIKVQKTKYKTLNTSDMTTYGTNGPVVLLDKTIFLGEKNKFKIRYKEIGNAKITYKVKNKHIATINKKGVVTGHKKGKTYGVATVRKDGKVTHYVFHFNVSKPLK